jgi:hypothetical protein
MGRKYALGLLIPPLKLTRDGIQGFLRKTNKEPSGNLPGVL